MFQVKSHNTSPLISCLYHWTVVLIVIAAVGSLSACSSKQMVSQATPAAGPTPLSNKLPLPKDLSTRWLKEVPCRPPCWEKVIPGVTSVSSATEMLAGNPIIGSVNIGVSKLISDFGELDWVWADGTDGGRATFHAQVITQPIYAIAPAFPKPISLLEVIQAYGEPSHVVATAYHGPDHGSGVFYDLAIIYESLGIRLHTGGTARPVLKEDMLFSDILFYDPSDEKFIKPQELLVPWQGIRDFSYYCRDQEEGQACRGGS